MTALTPLPLPKLGQKTNKGITILTDDALASSVGVFAGFTLRQGGVSNPPYDSLNLASHVNDRSEDVLRNRALLVDSLECTVSHLINPNQVHGTTVATVDETLGLSYESACRQAEEGADALIVNEPETMALLCYADCLPAIIVSPTGRFAVVHAGWRGALAGIVGKAARLMEQQDRAAGQACDPSGYNLYIGPYIHEECFEVSQEIADTFCQVYGPAVLLDNRHVSLGRAVVADATAAGMDSQRVADAQMCTVCHSDQVFSYRASGGVCGRHSAFGTRR